MVTRKGTVVQAESASDLPNPHPDDISRGTESPGARIAECPRCGYDLRGEVALWSDVCPAEGRCTECGLGFRWGRVLQPDPMPLWLFECRRGRRGRSVRTLLRSLVPWRMWRNIRMTMPVQRRLWLYPFALAFILALASAFIAVTIALPAVASQAPIDWKANAAGLLAIVVMPWSTEPVDATISRFSPEWMSLQTNPLTPQSPVAVHSSGAIISVRSMVPPPATLYEHIWGPVRPALEAMLAASLAAIATFVALPIVRTRARVRWPHVWRAGIYGLGIVSAVILLIWCVSTIAVLRSSGPRQRLVAAPNIWAFALPHSISALRFFPAALFIWWLAVSRHYLKLDRPAAVALAVTVVGLITGVVVFAHRNPHLVFRLLPMLRAE